MIFPMMAYTPKPEEQTLARRSRRAIVERLGLIVKLAAHQLGVTESYLNDALAARRPLAMWRLFRLEGFDVALAEVIAEEHDCFLIPKRDVRLIEIERQRRPMLKAQLKATQADEEVA